MTAQKLTDEQQIAVETVDQSLCILAGAGCGKTKVLVHHYLELLFRKKLKPSEIVAVTFTEKAANQLKFRIQEELIKLKSSISFVIPAEAGIPQVHVGDPRAQRDPAGQKHSGMTNIINPLEESVKSSPEQIDLLLDEISQSPISTLHSLGARIIRDASLLIGIDANYKILNPAEVSSLRYEAIQQTLENSLNENSKAVQHLISGYGWSNLQKQLYEMLQKSGDWKTISPEPLNEEGTDSEKQNWFALRTIFLRLIQNFEKMKQNLGGLDFDDLEEKAIELLENNLHVRKHYQKLMKAFLVDEFQDTNPRQEKLISLLIGINFEKNHLPSDKHLAIVGDPKQSIYAFREAKPDIFKKFQKLIEQNHGKTVYLSHNFRSSNRLVNWVNEVSNPLFEDYHPLTPTRFDLPTPAIEVLQTAASEKTVLANERRIIEAKILAKRISQLIKEGISPKKFFILFRSSTSIPIYLRELREEGIAGFVKSTESLLEQQEILDFIHAMRAVVEPANNLAWIGFLRSPLAGISDETLLERSLSRNKNEFEWFELHPLAKEIRKKNKNDSPTLFLEWLIDQTEIISLYNSTGEQKYKNQNILQFLNFAFEWEKKNPGGLTDFLATLDQLISRKIGINPLGDQLTENEAITLMTIHQSKGLDLPIVVLPDLFNSVKKDSVAIAHSFGEKIGFRLSTESRGLKRNFEDSENLKSIHALKKEIYLMEENRIFYVAITRAVEKIILGFLPKIDEKKKPLLYQQELVRSIANKKDIYWISEENLNSSKLESIQQDKVVEILRPLQKKRLTHFAVTQLEAYLRSPEEYVDQYIYQLPASKLSLPQTSSGNHPLALGNDTPWNSPLEKGKLIHEALCELTHPNSKKDLNEIIQTVLIRQTMTLNPEEENLFFSILEKTYSHPSFQPILNPIEGYSEIPFLLSLEGYELRGSIDRLIQNKNGWKIIDYKTHELSGNQAVELIAEQYRFQMKTYAVAASKMIGKAILEALIYFVIPNQNYLFEFSEDEIELHEKYLIELMDEINKKL